jgi:hypothetical protein
MSEAAAVAAADAPTSSEANKPQVFIGFYQNKQTPGLKQLKPEGFIVFNCLAWPWGWGCWIDDRYGEQRAAAS